MRVSRFVYDRSIVNDLADTLCAARANCWCEPQHLTLDWIIRSFTDQAFEHDPTFDVEAFATRAHFGFGRLPLAAHYQGDDHVGFTDSAHRQPHP